MVFVYNHANIDLFASVTRPGNAVSALAISVILRDKNIR
jgi:hypothetical protein